MMKHQKENRCRHKTRARTAPVDMLTGKGDLTGPQSKTKNFKQLADAEWEHSSSPGITDSFFNTKASALRLYMYKDPGNTKSIGQVAFTPPLSYIHTHTFCWLFM